MPQVDGAVIKERAATLRADGAAALARRLGAKVGRRDIALMETGDRGRLPDFTEVLIETAGQGDETLGGLVPVELIQASDTHLTGRRLT